MDQAVFYERLVDYLVLVGPGKGRTFNKLPLTTSTPTNSWHHVSKPVPTILNRFPTVDRNDFELAYDMAYFCQPDGSCSHIEEAATHIFMLTDTETNTKTYGMCLSLPHLFDPLLKAAQETNNEDSGVCHVRDTVDMCIQEWGTLSVCLLSRHPFFNFFTKSLKTLAHFVQDFSEDEPLWKELIQYKPPSVPQSSSLQESSTSPPLSSTANVRQRIFSEVLDWINQLLALKAPEQGTALEVELEVDPAIIVAYPSSNRLPLFELQLHQVFKRLDVCTVIDIYKLVLSEQKVIVHSSDGSFASECVLAVLTLLYPLQYLFPLIPLLPTSMPTAENLLMVPTPFVIGVCTSFLLKVHEVHLAEVWTIDLDTKKVQSPAILDQPVLEFPFCILQLQADIRRAMDKLEKADLATPSTTTGSHVTSPSQGGNHVATTPLSTTHALSHVASQLSFSKDNQSLSNQTRLGKDSFLKHLGDDVDVMIRVAFVDFLFSGEILGLMDHYLSIYRLFPRPVVTIRKSAFLSAYEKTASTTDMTFVRELMLSQGIEYFFEWSLNPTNASYEEIRRGIHDISRLSDKQFHYIHHQAFKTKQVCLYNPSPDSLLYQEMLNYKATQSSFHVIDSLEHLPEQEEDDSDWEYLTTRGEQYDGDSEESSYFSDSRDVSSSPSAPLTRRRLYEEGEGVAHRGVASEEVDYLDDDIEVGYYSTKKVPIPVREQEQEDVTSPADGVKVLRRHHSQPTDKEHTSPDLLPQTGQKMPRPKSLVSTEAMSSPVTATDNPKRSLSCENLSPPTLAERERSGFRLLGDQRNASSTYLTSTEYLTPHPFDTDTDHTHTDESQEKPHNHSVFSSDDETDGVRNTFHPHHHKRGDILHDNFILAPKLDHIPKTDPFRHSTDSNTSSDQMEFVTPASTLPRRRRSSSVGEDSGHSSHGQVARTILALSALNNSKTMDNQIVDIVTKVVGGQGISWPKPAALKRLSGYEKTRVLILRHLEERLGVRTSNDVVMATSAQITPVGVTKAVYRGVLDLLKFLLHCVEDDFQKEPEGPLFSVFLIFRLAFSVYHEPKQKSTIGFSLRSALSIGSSLLGTESPKDVSSFSDTSSQVTENSTTIDANRTQPQADLMDMSVFSSPTSSEGTGTTRNPNLKHTIIRNGTGPPRTNSEPQLTSSTPKTGSTGLSTQHVLPSPVRSTTKTSPLLGRSKMVTPRKDNFSLEHTKHSHLSSILGQDDLINQLINSPRFFHPVDGQDLKYCNFLYKELLKGLGNARPFLLKKEFWNNVFMSTVDADRSYLGWNERTADLYRRYNTLPEVHRRTFGSEEDHLLSIIAHNLLVYMLMVGLSAKETMNLVQRFTARTRLATFEEKLLQQTMRHVEQNASTEIDLSDLGLMALYSEIHPTISHIVHYGINMIAPVYKLQITDEALILRRFPDEKISARLWNDCITLIQRNDSRATVSVRYKDTHGEFTHHFHTKQFQKVYDSLQALVLSVNNQCSPE